MGKTTGIEWCDSTINTQQGCEGCELVKGQEKTKCHANVLVDRYKGLKGWVKSFDKPEIFLDRIPKMLSWEDLSGKERKYKPWLNGLPRLIFMNDMGDTFTKGLPRDWFADVLPYIRQSPHQYLILSKWPNRFADFSKRYELPKNIWAGTSVTTNKTKFRINHIYNVKGSPIKWVSIEPMWEQIDLSGFENLNWIVLGGESGHNPSPCKIEWFESVIEFCQKNNIPVFVKQLGTYLAKNMGLNHSHGGDINEMPENLRIRQFPKIKISCNIEYQAANR